MKKLAIGCGLVVLLLGIGAAVAGYYVYRQVGSAVAQFAEFAEVPDLERRVANQQPFTPPASGELTREQVERLVRVQRLVRDELGVRIAAVESRYETLLEQQEASIRDLPQVIAVYRDLAGTWMDAKRRQVEALNETGFSLAEYRWVRRQAYAALGVPFVDVDVSRLIEEARRGESADEAAASGQPAVHAAPVEANTRVVDAFRPALEENAPLAALGL